MDTEQILAFRLARSGLARRQANSLGEAAACPASDFSRDAAILAVAARMDGVTQESYDRATDSGELVVAHVVRGAIHVVRPEDFGLFGRAVISTDDDELGVQLGRQVQGLAEEKEFRPTDALKEVAEATKDALGGGQALDKNDLHAALRERVGEDLMPWCKGCRSHHVAPMLWRYATVAAGARLDSERRYTAGKPGGRRAGGDVVRKFLRFYGPSTPGEFAEWAGMSKPQANRIWKAVEGELAEVKIGAGGAAWVLDEDLGNLESPGEADGVRLIPPGDPYLQKANRSLLAGDADLRKRLFRPVASPGVVLKDGRLVGLWRVKAKGKQAEVSFEKIGRIAKADLEEEAGRIAELRGASGLVLVLG